MRAMSWVPAWFLCVVVVASCGKEPVIVPEGLGGPCTRNADCASPFICLDAKCVPTPIGCQPGEQRCNGDTVEKCDESGSSFAFLEQCAAGCEADECKAVVCTAGTRRCEGDALTACLPNGSGYAFVQFCSDACRDGACQPPPQACTPLANRCNGLALETCLPEGQGWSFVQFCATGCAEGACVQPPPACDVDETRCNGRAVELCTPDRKGFGFLRFCDFACEEGACTDAPEVCEPRSTRCNGRAVEACTPDGGGFAFVQYCATECVDGACAPALCRPFATRCASATSIETCSAEGLAWEASACGEDRACELGECVPVTCEPEARRCANGAVETCNSLGTAWRSSDDCAHGCLDGQCLEAACVAGARRCNDRAVEACLPDGTGHVFLQFCATNCLDGACTTAVCRPGDMTCGDATTLRTCNGDGTAWVDSACEEGRACDRGECRPTLCAPEAARCAGRVRETCNALGTEWNAAETCQFSCEDGVCAEAACGAGTRRCNGAAVEACRPDGTGYAFVEFCNTSCVAGACAVPICVPLGRRCSGNVVQVCNGTGAAWVNVETCSNACTEGFCVASVQQCSPGSRRCNGREAQVCAVDGLSWVASETCTGTCNGGACSGGGCRSFSVTSTPATIPADGVSTVLVSTGLVADVAGVPVPDGVLLTVAVTGGAVASVDADPVASGSQVRVLEGRARFSVRAPSAAGSVSVSVSYRDSTTCAGTTTISAVAPTGRMVFAEDFSGTARRDPVATTADWDAARQRVLSLPFEPALGVNTGTGRDGDLSVSSGQTFNLQTSTRPGLTGPDVAVHTVTFIDTRYGNDFVFVDPPANATLAPGDEVLLVNGRGGNCGSGNTCPPDVPGWAGQVGTYEFLTVRLARPDGLVFFTSQVRNTYSDGGNADLRGQRIFVQRVPNYDRVTIDGTLTSEPWTPETRKTGMIVFRSRRGISINAPAGRIDANGLGYRGGRADTAANVSRNLYDNGSPTYVGQAGESWLGEAHYYRDAWSGGGGGFYGFCGWWNQGDTRSVRGGGGGYATGGHKLALVDETWPEGDLGRGGTYGDAQMSRLYLGSGGGASGTLTIPCFYNQRIGSCDNMTHSAGVQCNVNTYCYSDGQGGSTCERRRCNARSCQMLFALADARPGGRGGGLVALWTHTLTVAGGGITANGAQFVAADNGGSGGSVLIHANSATLGAGLVTALGAYTSALTVPSGQRPPGDGRVAINYFDFALTGTTNPPAWTNLLGVFRKNMAQSFSVDSIDGPRVVTAVKLASTTTRTAGGDITFYVSADGGRTWTAAAAVGTDVAIAAPARGADLRWRAEFRPLNTEALSVDGLVLDFAVQ